MKIFVINLLRAEDRKKKILQQFNNLDLSAHFVTAVDGKTLTTSQLAMVNHNRRKAISAYPLTPNEIGCYVSHLNTLNIFLESDDDMAVILEDDAILSPDFATVIRAIEHSQINFDFIDLHRNLKKTEFFVPLYPLLPHFSIGRIGYMHMRAIAYVVTREGAQKILSSITSFAHAYDKEIHSYWKNKLNIFGLETAIVYHNDQDYSFIEETREQDSPTIRLKYNDSHRLYWRIRRLISRLYDSIAKRSYFHLFYSKIRILKKN
jgi:glycosyl transferase family 25